MEVELDSLFARGEIGDDVVIFSISPPLASGVLLEFVLVVPLSVPSVGEEGEEVVVEVDGDDEDTSDEDVDGGDVVGDVDSDGSSVVVSSSVPSLSSLLPLCPP